MLKKRSVGEHSRTVCKSSTGNYRQNCMRSSLCISPILRPRFFALATNHVKGTDHAYFTRQFVPRVVNSMGIPKGWSVVYDRVKFCIAWPQILPHSRAPSAHFITGYYAATFGENFVAALSNNEDFSCRSVRNWCLGADSCNSLHLR